MRNLRELPKLRDGLGYLYFEHGRVEQQDKSIALIPAPGDAAPVLEVIAVPAAALAVLMLGPGTTVTHAAIKALSENGCSVQWTGEDGQRFYAQGSGETRSAARLLRQVAALASTEKQMQVVLKLYRMRFAQALPAGLSLQQLRGHEGVRVRDAYALWSKASGVEWKGRNYDRGNWRDADPINRAISAGNACLYGLAHAAIVSMGFSPALGFIHVGKQLSFVYDVADLYKLDAVIPVAFATVAESSEHIESRVRKALRERCRSIGLLERMSGDLLKLFDLGEDADPWASDAAAPGNLWDRNGEVAGGHAYDDALVESPDSSAAPDSAEVAKSDEPPF